MLVRVRVISSTVPDEQIKDIIWAQVWCEASLADLWHNWHREGEEALKRQCAISKKYENKTDVDVQTEFGCLTAQYCLLCSCLIGDQGHKGEATQVHPCFIVLDKTIMSSSCELTVWSIAGYKVTGIYIYTLILFYTSLWICRCNICREICLMLSNLRSLWGCEVSEKCPTTPLIIAQKIEFPPYETCTCSDKLGRTTWKCVSNITFQFQHSLL